jgi:hypothetical protein
MIPPLSYILIPTAAAFLSGILGTLLTIFLTPRLQHRFWKYQRREELRFAAITEMNRLVAEFSVYYVYKKNISEKSPELGTEFFQSWFIVDAQMKTLFSNSTYQVFDKMRLTFLTASLYSKQEMSDRSDRIQDLTQKHNAALSALYKEIELIK